MNLKNNKIIKTAFLTGIISVTILGGYSVLNKEITLVVNGEERKISTFKSNVEELLDAENIKYDKNDIISQKLDTKLNDGMKVEVIDVIEEVVKESKSVPYEITVIEDNNLLKGETKVEEEGKTGENELVYKIVYHNGKQVEKTFLEEVVSSEPTNKVIKKGTKVEEIQVASSRGESTRQNTKHTNTVSSTSSNQSSNGKYMSVVATAYTGHGITATGTTPKWGTIAVDPSIIPYGTKVYIPQFNKTFIAEDCGGAIKGNKIDIYMNNEDSVYNWGRKTIDIYIVN
ncbi:MULTISPECIES: 3D domain-containing protein [unclassified Romboutsia]|uniref:3D domain-containing protein n=1 Tax=unclassified Romboutsia TaxID=2626894 RepID=UPI00082149C3|nr:MULTISPECIES: 3D domain-containing protein [unclassified Romboutsia]SCH36572.1 Cell wall-binding protein yocH precursor [uncultured Clostridium sp.]